MGVARGNTWRHEAGKGGLGSDWQAASRPTVAQPRSAQATRRLPEQGSVRGP
jgi:hypothetical protein